MSETMTRADTDQVGYCTPNDMMLSIGLVRHLRSITRRRAAVVKLFAHPSLKDGRDLMFQIVHSNACVTPSLSLRTPAAHRLSPWIASHLWRPSLPGTDPPDAWIVCDCQVCQVCRKPSLTDCPTRPCLRKIANPC